MLVLEYPELAFTQVALILISAYWMIRRNDEIPLVISSLLFYVGSYRYWAVTNGFNQWIDLKHYGFIAVTTELATDALNYIVLGQVCTLSIYMWRQKKTIPVFIKACVPFRSFFNWLRPKILGFGLLCIPLVLLARSSVQAQADAGRSLAFQVSGYLQQFPMVLIGIATLLLCLWKFGGMPSFKDKAIALFILTAVTYLTFGISGRFQFLGWIVTFAIILSSSYKPKVRLIILVLFSVAGLAVFGVAGAMRGTIEEGGWNQAAWGRLFSAEDANMLDGFALLESAFPRLVPFRLGMAHLEILMRPIPRALWSDKPVGGGYAMEVGLIDPYTGASLGFSPTLYGDFYSEAGAFGIILLSCLYGAVFAAIVQRSARLHPFAGVLIRAILSASLIPLLRGGDLPGIFAWIGMSFWPCFLLLWLKRKQFSKTK